MIYDTYGYYQTPTKTLTLSEEKYLNVFMNALHVINPSLHRKLSCMKWMGVSPGSWDGVYIPMPEI